MKKSIKNMGQGLLKIVKFCVKWTVIIVLIGNTINAIGGALSKRAEKIQSQTRNKTNVTSVDNTNNKLTENKGINEEKNIVVEKQKKDNREKEEELLKKQELQKKYSYVSGPIIKNNKKYWQVKKQGISYHGLVDYDTNIEVIKPGTYDYIGNEIQIAGINYVQVSIPYDDGCAYGLLNLDNFVEVIPCGYYRDVDIYNEEERVECLNKDRTTVDTYKPNDDDKILIKTK